MNIPINCLMLVNGDVNESTYDSICVFRIHRIWNYAHGFCANVSFRFISFLAILFGIRMLYGYTPCVDWGNLVGSFVRDSFFTKYFEFSGLIQNIAFSAYNFFFFFAYIHRYIRIHYIEILYYGMVRPTKHVCFSRIN